VNKSAKIAVGVIVGLVGVAVGGFVLLNVLGGGDGPEELTFADAPTTTAAPGGPSSEPAGESLDGPWVIGGGSQAGYRVLEDRIGGLQNIEAVGRTDKVTGGFTVAGSEVSDINAEVQVATITSDSSFRDGRFAGGIMDTQTFPVATFAAPTASLGSIPADGETVTVPVSGELTLKGVTKPVETQLEVKRAGRSVQVLGSVPVVFADYGIETPQPPGLSVRNEGTVEFLLVAEPG